MPELPEIQVTSELLSERVGGLKVVNTTVRGVSTLKSFNPPLHDIHGQVIKGLSRVGKHILIDFGNDLTLLIHLMSAGRVQLFDKPGSPKDRITKMTLYLEDLTELRLREFGTKQSMWAKLLYTKDVANEESISTLGPEAWPDPPAFSELLDSPRPLNALLRDQRVIAGVGRSWADEILNKARLSPFKRGDTLTEDEATALREATVFTLQSAIDHYREVLSIPIPDKLPMPLKVHRMEGTPCPQCAEELKPVYFDNHTISYCPSCQTGGKILKDRRLSKLLK